MEKKRILLVTHEIPYPADRDGWSVITYPILAYLHASYDIDLVFPILKKHKPLREEHLRVLRKWCKSVNTFTVSHPFVLRAFTALFHPLPLVYTLYGRKKILDIVTPLLNQKPNAYKAIIIADPHCARFISKINVAADVRKIFIASDYTTLMFKRIFSTHKTLLSKIYHWITYQKLRLFEPLIYNLYDNIVYVSDVDKKHFCEKHPEVGKRIVVIPNGINLKKMTLKPFSESVDNLSILFVGNMNYMPNRQAAKWFYSEVFDTLKKEVPEITYTIVGRDAGRFFDIKDSNVSIHSSVPLVRPYIEKTTIFISPLQSGTGLKNKVVEAMACGKVVVGSKLSFDGIPVVHGRDAIIAETASDYICELKRYLRDSRLRQSIGENAYAIVKENFDIESIVEKWKNLIEGGDENG